MNEYVRSRDHHRRIEAIRKEHRREMARREVRYKESLQVVDAKGYARGVEHGWQDALRKLRGIVGAETSGKLKAAALDRASRVRKRAQTTARRAR